MTRHLKQPERQYLALMRRIIEQGTDIYNERTGKFTRTVIDADLVYDVGSGVYPLLTTRPCNPKPAFAELTGYLLGLDSAAGFRTLGTKTWDANANLNEAWLANPHRRGTDDMGRVYGVIGHDFGNINQFMKVYNNLKNGIDDRGEIITYWKPDEFDKACLRPCMYQFQFSLLGDDLYLHATQRSCDVPLGLAFNMQQVWLFLRVMADMTGKNPKLAFHKIVNAHIYEDQLELAKKHIERVPNKPPTVKLKKARNWGDLNKELVDSLEVIGYKPHKEPIRYPFSV
ncbi:thymidylate synthase (plasmid) [Halobacteriovorax sp. GFR7]|uniref:thymidylate synthase n=1 Tax=unclassified Halobacteriovorax TaxID=2639665 RepID=UPI003D9895A6